MSRATGLEGAPAAGRLTVSMHRIEHASLFLLMASSFLVFVEPSPYEYVFTIVLVVFAVSGGLRISPLILPLVVCMFGYTLGGFFSLLPHLSESDPVMFTITSAYMSVTTIFYAMLLRVDALGRLDALRKGYIFAAIVASAAALIGYFGIGGLGELFTRYGRATGTFKDPNVLGTFVILPLVYVVRSLFVDRVKLSSMLAAGLIVFGGVFLSFSRGAWIHAAASLALMAALTFFFSRSPVVRRRIVVVSIVGVAMAVVLLSVAISFDAVGRLFAERANFQQDYDIGAQGRFGRQLIGIPMLLDRPNGFGPHVWGTIFGEDPHEVFLNAFASYGWLGGFSYLTLILMTLIIGWRVCRARTPLQPHAIVIWSTLFIQILQGLQIDTDHWRHFWLMIGLIWGILPSVRSASIPRRSPPRQDASVAAGGRVRMPSRAALQTRA